MQEDNIYDDCDFEDSVIHQKEVANQTVQQSTKLSDQELVQSLHNMSTLQLRDLMGDEKQKYDISRTQFGRMNDQYRQLQKQGDQINKDSKVLIQQQEKQIESEKYVKGFIDVKCTLSKMLALYNCNKIQRISTAFMKLKVNARRQAMSQNYRIHSLQMNLQKKVISDITRRLVNNGNQRLREAFDSWKINDTQLQQINQFKHKIQKQINELNEQLEYGQEQLEDCKIQGVDLNCKQDKLRQKLSQLQKYHQEALNKIRNEQDRVKKGNVKDIAQQHIDQAIKARASQREQQSVSQMSKRGIAKKESIRQKLQDQYNQEKRTNRQLKHKQEENDALVQQFLGDMNNMIENAEQDQDFDLQIDFGLQPPAGAIQSERNERVPQTIHQQTIPNEIPRSNQRYQGQQQYGGSGESTGGSARHY